MDSHEVMKEVLKKTSAKQIAAEMGLSLSLINKWAEPPEPGLGSINPLGRMSVIIAAAKEDRPVKWLCRKAGGFFVKNPAA